MKFSTVIAVAIASFVLTACTSNANHDVMKPEVKAHKMESTMKDTMKDTKKNY